MFIVVTGVGSNSRLITSDSDERSGNVSKYWKLNGTSSVGRSGNPQELASPPTA